MKEFIKNNKIILIAVLGLLISRIPCIFFNMHGINFDEAAIDYNIFCLSEYGVDRYLNPYPVYFANATSGQSALYVYIGVILSEIFGFSITLCRMVKLIGEVVTIVLGGTLVKNIFGKRIQYIFFVLYIICPYFYKMAGMSYDCDMIIPMFVVCMYMAYKCMHSNSIWRYIGLGVCLGILKYSYIMAVLMVPLFIIVQFVGGFNRKYVIVEAIVSIIVGFPMTWYLLTLLDIAPAITTDFITISPVSAYRKKDLGFEFENLINLKYMIVTDTQADFSGSKIFGPVYYLTWLMVPVGIGKMIYDIKTCFAEKYIKFLMFIGVAFLPLLLIRSASTYNFTIIYFFIVVLAAVGIDFMISNYKLLAGIIGIAYVVMFGCFLNEYFVREPYIYGDDLIMDALEYIEGDEKVMIDTTSIFQIECYIGVNKLIHPKEIKYDSYGRGTSVGNIYFNDADGFQKYDKIFVRTQIKYYYETPIGGLSDEKAKDLIVRLGARGYKLEQIPGYYVYSK